jgi:hypothetical protein
MSQYGAEVEWYWQKKIEELKKKKSQCHYGHHKSHRLPWTQTLVFTVKSQRLTAMARWNLFVMSKLPDTSTQYFFSNTFNLCFWSGDSLGGPRLFHFLYKIPHKLYADCITQESINTLLCSFHARTTQSLIFLYVSPWHYYLCVYLSFVFPHYTSLLHAMLSIFVLRIYSLYTLSRSLKSIVPALLEYLSVVECVVINMQCQKTD